MKKEKFNIYDMITKRMIDKLEKGIVPWQKPWNYQPAISHVTGKPYSIMNQLLVDNGGEYLTFNQIKEAGGKLKKGSKAEQIVFWKNYSKVEHCLDDDGNETEEVNIKNCYVLRYYNVFSINDCEGIEAKYPQENVAIYHHKPIERAEEIVRNYLNRNSSLTLSIQNAHQAYYSPGLDRVVMPCKEQFEEVEKYYSTLFHELVHSTGIEGRCNREMAKTQHSEKYSKEELIAEIGAATLVNICGIESEHTFDNSTAYIQSWINTLKNDNRILVSATSKAEKAVNFILGNTEVQTETEDEVESEIA